MTLKPKQGWFLAFTALFAVLAGFVFWGTWSLDVVPIMPDCPTSFPTDYVEHWIRGWFETGKFVPGDVIAFLGSPYFWVELQYVLATYCAALGLVYFLRGRGLSPLASYGAGLFLAFCGYWLTLFSAGHLGWFQWMTYGVFAFGLIDRALVKGKMRHWVLLGACLAWGSFYQPDLWLLFTVFTAAYFVFRWVQVARAGTRDDADVAASAICRFFPVRWIKGACLALATFVVIGLPSFRSAIVSDLASRNEQIGASAGGAGADTTDAAKEEENRWLFVTNWSMPPEDTREFFNARCHGDTSCPMTLAIGTARGNRIRPYTGRLGRPKDAPSGNYRQHSLYVGHCTCLLALFAVLCCLDPRLRRMSSFAGSSTIVFFAVAALVFWLFSLGRFCAPVYRLVYALPMGDYLRAPVKWHHLTEFCLVVLAGYGLQLLLDGLVRAPAWTRRGYVPLLALVLFGACDLAGEAKRFCAPHRADAQPAPIMQAPVPTADPVKQAQVMAAARKQDLSPIGFAPLAQLTPDPRAVGLSVLWIDQTRPRPDVRPIGKPLAGAAFGLAALSAFSTLGVLAFLITSLVRRRNAQKGVS